LIQDADLVPVGQDQKQHVEYARDIAEKFNRVFCLNLKNQTKNITERINNLTEIKLDDKIVPNNNIYQEINENNDSSDCFHIPQPYILKNVETVPGTDGRKMSKSYNNTIPLFATYEEIKKAVMSIPTDSKGVAESKNPDESNIFAIHKLLLNDAEKQALAEKYIKGGMGYKEAKESLIDALEAFIKPLREKRAMLASDLDTVFDILKEGGKRASKRAEDKMKKVRKLVGVKIY
jgi:tryptophanyl-tRNA synthetase